MADKYAVRANEATNAISVEECIRLEIDTLPVAHEGWCEWVRPASVAARADAAPATSNDVKGLFLTGWQPRFAGSRGGTCAAGQRERSSSPPELSTCGCWLKISRDQRASASPHSSRSEIWRRRRPCSRRPHRRVTWITKIAERWVTTQCRPRLRTGSAPADGNDDGPWTLVSRMERRQHGAASSSSASDSGNSCQQQSGLRRAEPRCWLLQDMARDSGLPGTSVEAFAELVQYCQRADRAGNLVADLSCVLLRS